MRSMFPEVESLVRLLLINPASFAAAERSFSGMRRLKSYIRSTCGQLRLNSIALCRVHKNILDKLDIEKNGIYIEDRQSLFGVWQYVKLIHALKLLVFR